MVFFYIVDSIFFLSFSLSTDRKIFLATWKEIPLTNEVQSTINVPATSPDSIQTKLEAKNVFVIARRKVEVAGATQVSILEPLWIPLGQVKVLSFN